MVVKDKVGRKRYIAFIVKSKKEIKIEELNRAILSAIKNKGLDIYFIKPCIVYFEDNKGILRCSHLAKEETIKVLNSVRSLEISIQTLKTSGTIKGAKNVFNSLSEC